ncbi:PAS domain S-box protein [Endothiovibrio diazotrophicus]
MIPGNPRSSHRLHLSLLMVALIGVALATAVLNLLQGMERRQVELAFTRDADDLIEGIKNGLTRAVSLVEDAAGLVVNGRCDDGAAFTRRLAQEASRSVGVVAVVWAENAGGGGERDLRLPIACRFAPASSAFPDGADLAAEPLLAGLLALSIRQRSEVVLPTGADRLKSVGGEGGSILLKPLFAEEQGELTGFVAGLFRPKTVVETVLAGFTNADFHVGVSGEGGETIVSYGGARRADRSEEMPDRLGAEARIDIAGYPLTIRVEAPPDYRVPGSHGRTLAWWAFVIILLLTGLLVGYLRALHMRADALQRLADNRQRSEKMAREREQILQSLGEGVYGIDREGRTTFFNRAAERILGWGEGELLGMAQHELFHHTRADGSPYPVEECPIHRSAREGERCHVEEDRFWHRDGYAIPVEYTSAPLFDDKGTPHGAVVVFSDITQRLVAEARLQREHELLARIMDTSPSGVLVANHRGRFVFSNRRALEIFQCSREEIIDRDFSSPELHAKTADGGDILMEQLPFRRIVSAHRHIFDMQFTILRRDGKRRLLSVNGAPVFDSVGRLERVVFTLGDITARQAEEQERIRILEENRRLTRQLFKIQEEERRAIARDLHDELGQYLVAMRTELKLIGRMVGEEAKERLMPLDELLDQTHGVVRGIIHRLRPVLLEKLGLRGAVEELVGRWEERHPEVEVELEFDGQFAGIENDVAHTVYRLVQEGLTNIDKYADAGRVEIQIATRDESPDDEALTVTVRDNGRGYSEVRSGGMGQLGMRERVASLNGRFSVISELGKGVVLHAEIPLNGNPFE